MANLKDITKLPLAESAEGVNLIVNDNGAAKQIAASAVGAQADWTETDETSPAFVKNKPVEELDLDIDIISTYDVDNDEMVVNYTVNSINTYANIKDKIFNGEMPKCKSKLTCQPRTEGSPSSVEVASVQVTFFPEGFDGTEDPGGLAFFIWGINCGFVMPLTSDDVIQGVFFN
jgi:hypothetical protein